MKRILILLTLALTVSLSVNAQNKQELPSPEERAKMQTEFMKEKLKLTESQVPKALAINLETAKKMDYVMSISDKMKKFKEFRAVQMKKDEAFKALLTKEQFKLYKKSKEEIKKLIKKKRKEKK